MTKIPADIFASIKSEADETWGDDAEMVRFTIESESSAYIALTEIDFGEAAAERERILGWAADLFELWEDRANFVQEEVDAFAQLQISPGDMPSELFGDLKRKAVAEHDWFSAQLDEVEKGISHFRYVRDLRAKIEPMRDLLTRMENILGAECYNSNIQNYSSWGEWEGEGRSFRYPVTFLKNAKEEKRWGRTDDLECEDLATGHYKFGANELSVYRALIKIIDMLEADYGLDVRLADSIHPAAPESA